MQKNKELEIDKEKLAAEVRCCLEQHIVELSGQIHQKRGAEPLRNGEPDPGGKILQYFADDGDACRFISGSTDACGAWI